MRHQLEPSSQSAPSCAMRLHLPQTRLSRHIRHAAYVPMLAPRPVRCVHNLPLVSAVSDQQKRLDRPVRHHKLPSPAFAFIGAVGTVWISRLYRSPPSQSGSASFAINSVALGISHCASPSARVRRENVAFAPAASMSLQPSPHCCLHILPEKTHLRRTQRQNTHVGSARKTHLRRRPPPRAPGPSSSASQTTPLHPAARLRDLQHQPARLCPSGSVPCQVPRQVPRRLCLRHIPAVTSASIAMPCRHTTRFFIKPRQSVLMPFTTRAPTKKVRSNAPASKSRAPSWLARRARSPSASGGQMATHSLVPGAWHLVPGT